MKLTDVKLRNLSEPGKYFDGSGLFIHVKPTGGRYWRFKYRVAGKEKLLSIGTYPAVGLKDAREAAEAARKTLQSGGDPAAHKQEVKAQKAFEAANTFEAVASDWLEHQSPRWSPETKERIAKSLAADIYPALGARPMVAIKPGEVMRAVQKIEARGAGDQAGRVLQRVKSVYRWAVIHGRVDNNPMIDLVPSEILKPREVQHRAALSDRELPEFLAKLDAYNGDPTTANALRFLMLTATRPGEVRGARWVEIDTDQALWTIPAGRMKTRTEHRVPLSRQALKVLETMRSLNGDRDLVFASPTYKSQALSENTLNGALRRMGYPDATAHGFRSLFSTLTNEHDRTLGDVVERALAHKDKNKVRAAYLRSTFLNDRVRLMQWWADHLDAKRAGAEVIQLDAHRAA